jgi:pyruvate, water dikinase
MTSPDEGQVNGRRERHADARASTAPDEQAWVRWFEELSSQDLAQVGGKNSSLGEMIGRLADEGVRVPGGFATTAHAYREFLAANDLQEQIRGLLAEMDEGRASLARTGKEIRARIGKGRFPPELARAIRDAYRELGARVGREDTDVAVRSSATAEDLPEASFAGQQESFLNVEGEDALLDACRRCYASLFTDRAISYREQHGFGHLQVALSVGVQEMVRSDLAGAGVLFTLDTDTGFPDLVLINAAWGLGETVVQGTIEPDQYRVFKPFLHREGKHPVIEKLCGAKEKKLVYQPSAKRPGGDATTRTVKTSAREQDAFVLSDDEIAQLARWGAAIERHYGVAMDVEWAKDGRTEELFIVQARPETVHARKGRGVLQTFELQQEGKILATGLAIGQAIAAGPVRIVRELDEMEAFQDGSVLVTEMTDPDWGPVMRRASAIVTDHGGRTSHAAIVSRELGVPAVVGTGKATQVLRDDQEVTVSCQGASEGRVYEGRLKFESRELDVEQLPGHRTRILMNIASPAAALGWWRLPVQGIGLARMEYLVNNIIRIHPMALAHLDQVQDQAARAEIEQITRRYRDKPAYFVDQLAQGIALMAAACYPEPVVVRLSDFKTNEYAQLLGGRQFEPAEENPMLGWRGASRYYDEDYRDGFALECRAFRRVRDELGFDNVIPMVPFCRTPAEADKVLAAMAEHGLERGERGLQVWVMAEIPSNILECEAFADRFDGFSIGSNDLTQLVLGVSRDAEKLGALFDEGSPSVKWMIEELARRAHAAGRPVSLCGQAPSDDPAYAAFLVEAGLDSISVNPDSVARVIEHVARAENQAGRSRSPRARPR